MIPDYCEALTAYRAFDVFPNGLLAGQAVTEPWPPFAPFVARCASVTGDGYVAHLRDGAFLPAPQRDCDCGIHALKLAQSARARVVDDRTTSWFSSHDRPSGRAWGTVKLWGRVIEHQDGYRSEFAYPSSLHCDNADLAPKIAALYGIPCVFTSLNLKPKDYSPWADSVVAPIFSVPTYYIRSAQGLHSLVVDPPDTSDTIIQPPPAPRLVKPQIVGASRFQIQQYAKGVQYPLIVQRDWRDILRGILHTLRATP